MLSQISDTGTGVASVPWSCVQPAKTALLASADTDYRLTVHNPDDHGRSTVQALIQHVYGQAYGARVAAWMPVLLGLCSNGSLLAAAGYRAAVEPLYLEGYLDQPVQQVLQQHCGVNVPREQIVEVGHFSAASPGAGRLLIPRLGPHLRGLGFRWAVSTVGAPLYALLRRAGYVPVPLMQADPCRLPDTDRAAWGSYYESRPVVVAIDLYTPKALELGHEQH